MQHNEEQLFHNSQATVANDLFLSASCFWCERVHPGAHPLSICPACTVTQATLQSLEMSGPFALTDEAIHRELTRRSPGNYALGYTVGGAFKVFYVGRSNADLKRRLHEWVGMPSRYERYAGASKAAWALRRSGGAHGVPQMPAFGQVVRGESNYTRFAFSYAPSAAAAFEKESRNYDDFGGCRELDNAARPTHEAI